jgi:glyoxylase-like metal-dependent hydrolase (beta-lactamase superfamily II)
VTSFRGETTAFAVSPDSGTHWTTEGAWKVADGIYRVPLPLPTDGLKAVNIYVLQDSHGLTLIDGGWAIAAGRTVLSRSLRSLGFRLGDIRRFLVTHSHRDHYTMASVLSRELGASVALGADERPTLELIRSVGDTGLTFADALLAAGAPGLAGAWTSGSEERLRRLGYLSGHAWHNPDIWLTEGLPIEVDGRELRAVHTPGHTPGHFVFADGGKGVLFAGDHVLPTITPSIGLTLPAPADPLGSYLGSLGKVLALPDLMLLPAHGPTAPSSHARTEELLTFHRDRLVAVITALKDGAQTGWEVAQLLLWTRRERTLGELNGQNQVMAVLETVAHLDLLVARGQVTVDPSDGVRRYALRADR